MRAGDKVRCIKDFWNFEKGEDYHIKSVWDDGSGCTIRVQLGPTRHAYMPFSKTKLEEIFTNLEIERRLKLRKINSI